MHPGLGPRIEAAGTKNDAPPKPSVTHRTHWGMGV